MKNNILNEQLYEFHHIGIPTNELHQDERYSSTFKMYTSTASDSSFRVQYHRFKEDSPLHSLIKTMPHVAFKVNDLKKAIKGRTLLLGPYFPFDRYEVAIVEINGLPIEFIKTDLSEEEIWNTSNTKHSYIYPKNNAPD